MHGSEKIDDFVNRSSSINTQRTYRKHLTKYFEYLGVKNIDDYFKPNKNYEKDLWLVASKLREEKSAPLTQKGLFSCVKKFFERNDVMIRPSVWEDIRLKNKLSGARAVTQKRTPNKTALRQILSHATIKAKAFFSFLAVTGMRVDEALNLTLEDIDIDDRHVRIRNNLTKTSVARDTFFTPEVQEMLSLWMRERERYLVRSYLKSYVVRRKLRNMGYTPKLVTLSDGSEEYRAYKDGKQMEKDFIINLEDRLFPFSYNNAHLMWSNLLDKAGYPYNKRDGEYYLYNIHCLRRFWFTEMESSGANINHVNVIGGHESLLNGAYTDFPYEALKQTYDDNMASLSIFTEWDKLDQILEPKIREHDRTISELVMENKRLREDMEGLLRDIYYGIGEPPITPEQKYLRGILGKRLKK
jgi:integrase